jgi:hypothetical protein
MKIRHIAATLAAIGMAAALSLGAVSPASATTVHPHVAPGSVLTSARITFFTDTDDKDGDTFVRVAVTDGQSNRLAALLNGFFGHFNDQTAAGPFGMVVRSGVTADALEGGNVQISITPNGHDTWNFSYELDLGFSDGSIEPVESGPISLNQDSRVSNLPILF